MTRRRTAKRPRTLAAACIALVPLAAAYAADPASRGRAVAAPVAGAAAPAARAEDGARRVATAATPAPDRVAVAGEIVPDPCMPRDDARADECARLAGIARDATTRFLRDETTGELWVLRVGSGVSPERARWLAQHGARVRVAGQAEGAAGLHALAVEWVWRAHDHDAAPHGGVVGMSGDRHLELVSRVGGDIRVCVLDAYMQPLDVVAASGTARIRDATGRARDGRLAPAREPGCFVVVGETRRPGDDDVTVDLDVRGERLCMSLPFAPTAGTPPAHGGHGTHAHH